MASGTPDHDPERCTPCRGTGRLSSGLGGTPHEVECPWCGGSGRRDASRDAQEHAPPVESSSASA